MLLKFLQDSTIRHFRQIVIPRSDYILGKLRVNTLQVRPGVDDVDIRKGSAHLAPCACKIKSFGLVYSQVCSNCDFAKQAGEHLLSSGLLVVFLNV